MGIIRIKGLTDEDFVNYKLPSMYICSAFCSMKCEKENGESCCQNSSLASELLYFNATTELIAIRYLDNPITKAMVISGLEPFDQFDEVLDLISTLRHRYSCPDPIVIYTGYNEAEIPSMITRLKSFENIIVKFGRYIPGCEPHFDEVLGVNLASDNQYAVRIS